MGVLAVLAIIAWASVFVRADSFSDPAYMRDTLMILGIVLLVCVAGVLSAWLVRIAQRRLPTVTAPPWIIEWLGLAVPVVAISGYHVGPVGSESVLGLLA